MEKITIKRGDTRNGIEATLKKNGEPVNLTDCTVLFYMHGKVNGSHAQVLDPAAGKVLYPLEANIVDDTGFFKGEFKVVYPDNRKDTFPNDGYFQIHIKDDLEVRSNEIE